MYKYEITTWFDGEEKKITLSKGEWRDAKAARSALLSAIKRTDKIAGLMATARIVEVDA